MILAVLDTNVVVQSAISSSRSASLRVLDAYFEEQFQIAYSSDTMEELLNVLLLPETRELHQLSDDEITELVSSLSGSCSGVRGERSSPTHSLAT